MLAILWLIVWATVGDAFYDDYNWYTSDDGVSDGAIDPQKVIRENFTHILRSFADSYIPTRGGDGELTLQKAKSKLRVVKVFTHTGNSKDFEPSKGQMLPLHDGAKFCTMGRHTKVACNHCTCVAGQLYMCTGMICPKATAKPPPVKTCKEGKRRKIDSCNYCYCRNGHEICSTKDCRLQHDHLLLRSQYTCHEGARRKIACNRCLCRHGEEYCTKKNCTKEKPTQLKLKQDNKMPEGRCNDGQTLKIDCRVCKCTQNRWHCSDKNCGVKRKPEKLLWAKCKEGTTRQLDACNTCYCRLGREICEKKVCDEEQHLQYYRNLRYYDGSQCDEGSYRKVDSCNYCLCLNGTELCTNRRCQENHLDFLRRRQDCDRWDVKYERCNRCECLAREWVCTQKLCEGNAEQESETWGEEGLKNNDNYFYLEICNSGQTRKLDDCNTCFCRKGQWFCQIQECKERSTKILPAKKITELKKSEIIKFFKNLVKQKTPIADNIFELETKDHGDNTYPGSNNNINTIPIVDAIEFLFPDIYENTDSYEDDENIRLNGIDIKLIGRFNGESSNTEVEKEEPATVEEPPCKRGSKKRIDCNKCYCRKGIWLCQNKDCGPDMAALPPNCKRHDKIIVDCVPCKCRRRGWKCYVRKKAWNCKPDGKGPPPPEPPVLDLPMDLATALRMTYVRNDDEDLSKKCKIGERHLVDSCNYCYCNAYHERVCSNNKCNSNPQLFKGDDRYPMNASEQKCKIGTRFKKGECNYCYCNYDRELVCSKNVCTRKLSIGPSVEKEVLRFRPAPKICLPHERFRIDNCNWCYCNATRHRICERNLPCNRTDPDRTWPPNKPRRGCFIGSRFEWGQCGYCYCTVWRKIKCLMRYNCIEDVITTMKPKISPKYRTKPRNSLNFECEVGQIQRIDDCNYCRCTFSRTWMCSDNVCPSNHDNHNFLPSKMKLCTDGIRRQVDACNYCVCHTGVEYCTQKTCWRDTVPTLYSKPECLVGDPVPAPDPCNLCICLDSDILCTDNPCIQRQSIEYKQSGCVTGHKYRMDDGCNFCLCQDGQEFCTSRACLVHGDHGLDSAGCDEGEVTAAEDGCNMCVCMRGKIICTNKDCSRRKLGDATSESLLPFIRTKKTEKDKMTQGSKRRCIPGQNNFPDDFDPNCPNDCICDRHELLCTKRQCFNNWDKHTPFKWPLGRVEKKTRHAKQFLKQDCDEYQKMQSGDRCTSCMCLNGRKVCTIVKCSDDFDGQPSSMEALMNPQGSKGKKTNKNTFCEPFTFFSPDSNRFCRNCFCLHNGLALCLLNLCKYSMDIPHHNSPEELDEVCIPGETGYPTKCVTCTCSEQGKWVCTREELALCQERNCDQKDEFHMGFFPYCAGCKCAVKEWFCSIQSEACSDYSNATCPLGSFIRNPIQHCSICLCGGYEEGSHNMCFTEAKCVRQVINHLKL